MAIVHSSVVFSYYDTNMSFRPYHFEPLTKCSGHAEEDCGGVREKLQVRANVMNVIWKLSYR